MRQPTAAEVADAVRAELGARALGVRVADAQTASFPGRLLSARHAEAIPQGVQAVRVAVSTVITPLARDLLKKRGIALQLASSAAATAHGVWGFCLETSDGRSQALRRNLLQRDNVWYELSDAFATFDWVGKAPERGAVIATSRAALRTWEAGQIHGVRAAQAFDAVGLQRAIEDLAPNLLVLDMLSLSIPEVAHLCSVLQRSGAPMHPEAQPAPAANPREG